MLCGQDTRLFLRRAGHLLTFFLPALLLGGAGCKNSTQSGPGAPLDTTLRGILAVRVDPPQGISVLLDGNRVADHSPYLNQEVPAGSHVLEVRGMGRYPVTLPFSLAPNGRVDVPVVLRTRAATPLVDGQPAATAALPAGAVGGLGSPDGTPPLTRVRPSLPSRRNGPLPPGSTPLRLAVAPTPPARIVADGQEMAGTDVRLGYGQGLLEVGEMRLVYRIYPGRALEFTVPHEPVPWFLGDQQVKAKSLVRIGASPLILRRGTGPSEQQAWMRRLE